MFNDPYITILFSYISIAGGAQQTPVYEIYTTFTPISRMGLVYCRSSLYTPGVFAKGAPE